MNVFKLEVNIEKIRAPLKSYIWECQFMLIALKLIRNFDTDDSFQ